MDAKQAKLSNIVDMAFGFSAMTRVFEKKSADKIVAKLNETLSKIDSLTIYKEFQNLHDDFCLWFVKTIKTAERKKKNGTIQKSNPASYGQGVKVLDVALKVWVYYCQLPNLEIAQRTVGWLNAAIDTSMIRHLKRLPSAKSSPITAISIGDITKDTYFRLQHLVREDIQINFPSTISPVEWDDIRWRELNK